jgi:NADPH2:quinone reductase
MTREEGDMRAFATDGFGHPGTMREVADPEPAEGDVLIRVAAAGLNATDLLALAGWLKDYIPHEWPLIPGIDGSGVVERLGPGVTGFEVGEEVFGFRNAGTSVGRGTLAELVAIPAAAVLRKPPNLAHHEAATIPHSLLTATAAFDAAKVSSGDRVVVLGATGGVGSYATQMLAGAGAEVVGITIGEHADYARELGASQTIDYHATDAPAEVGRLYPDGIDAVLDLASFPELAGRLSELVRQGGRVVTLAVPPDVDALAARGVEGSLHSRWETEGRFAELAERVASGVLKLPQIRTFGFDETPEAMGLLATRHVRGKLVVTMA